MVLVGSKSTISLLFELLIISHLLKICFLLSGRVVMIEHIILSGDHYHKGLAGNFKS